MSQLMLERLKAHLATLTPEQVEQELLQIAEAAGPPVGPTFAELDAFAQRWYQKRATMSTRITLPPPNQSYSSMENPAKPYEAQQPLGSFILPPCLRFPASTSASIR